MGSLEDGAAAVSVAVGFGCSVGVAPAAPGVSVLVPAVPEDFLRLKMALSLSMASSAAIRMLQTMILSNVEGLVMKRVESKEVKTYEFQALEQIRRRVLRGRSGYPDISR